MNRRTTTAPARCVPMNDGGIGCSTRRWEERLVLSPRLYREARRHPDLAALLRVLHQEHDRHLPAAVWLGFELGSSARSRELGVELVGVSRCLSTVPPWAPRLRRPDKGCRLYTYFGFREEI